MAGKFPSVFVPNIEGSSYHPKWEAANKNGDTPKWHVYRDAVVKYKKGDPPVAIPAMATKYGKALVAAGQDYMSVTDLGTVWDPPAAPGTTYFTGDFETGTVTQWPDLHDCPANGRLIVGQPATSGASSNFAWRCQASTSISSGTGGGPSNYVEHLVNTAWERPDQITFYRCKLLLPSGSNSTYPGVMLPPTYNCQNTMIEWHNVSVGGYSTEFGFNAGGGANNNFWLQVAGGDTSITRQWFWDRQADNSTSIPVLYDTWCEVIFEVYWTHLGSIGNSPGYLKCWIDWGTGRRQMCPPASGLDVYGQPWPLNRPTLWRKGDGTYDPVWFEVGQYRWSGAGATPAPTQQTDLYMDDWKIGSTLTAVGG